MGDDQVFDSGAFDVAAAQASTSAKRIPSRRGAVRSRRGGM